jgi:hypothetical protein
MRGDALAQLNVLTRMSKVQEKKPRASHQVFIDVPLRKEPLFQNAGSTDASVATQQTQHPASVAHEAATCPTQSNFQRSFLRQQTCLSLWRPRIRCSTDAVQ